MQDCNGCPKTAEKFSGELLDGQVVMCTGCGARIMWNNDIQALTHVDEIPESEYLGG